MRTKLTRVKTRLKSAALDNYPHTEISDRLTPFFQIEKDEHNTYFKLNRRLVRCGNEDIENRSIRSNLSTGRFCVIKILLSIVGVFPYYLNFSLGIKSPFLHNSD